MNYHEKELQRRKQYADWLATLKVGDRVCFVDYSGFDRRRSYRILTIERMTATQAVCSNSIRFRLKDGHLIGSVNSRKVEAITYAVLQANDEANLKNWFSSLQSQRTLPSIEVIRAVKEAYEGAIKAEKGIPT